MKNSSVQILVFLAFLSGCTTVRSPNFSSLHRQARTLEQSSFEASRTGALPRAIGLEEQALDLYRRGDSTAEIIASLNRLGSLRLQQGELTSSLRDFTEAYELSSVLGNGAGRAAAANNLGSLARLAGDPDLAERRFGEAIDTPGATPETRASGFNNRALLRFDAGDPAAARQDLARALAVDRAANNRGGEALRLRNLAAIDLHEGELDAAIRGLSSAHKIDVQRGDPSAIARDLEALAVARWVEGDAPRLALSERRRAYNIDRLQGAAESANRQRLAIENWCKEGAFTPRPLDCVFPAEDP